MKERDSEQLRHAFAAARRARDSGNQPFGAVLVDENGRIILEGENTVVTERDCSGHAELNVLREATRRHDPGFLARCTMYASTEPCAMCAAATVLARVGRVVFGLSSARLYDDLRGGREVEPALRVPSADIFSRGRPRVESVGPVLEDEAAEVHRGYWD